MEKTIRTIISNNMEGNKKNYDKSFSDCKKQEIKYLNFKTGVINLRTKFENRKNRDKKNGRS